MEEDVKGVGLLKVFPYVKGVGGKAVYSPLRQLFCQLRAEGLPCRVVQSYMEVRIGDKARR